MPVTLKKHSGIGRFHAPYHTPIKGYFWRRYDARPQGQSLWQFIKEHKEDPDIPTYNTALLWLKTAKELKEAGHSPSRRKGPLGMTNRSKGRRNTLADAQVEVIANGPELVRKKDYGYHERQAHCSYRTLRRRIVERDPPVLHSRRRQTTEISANNKSWRVGYGQRHSDKDVASFFAFIHWTDEAHIPRAMDVRQYIFREEGNYQGLQAEKPSKDDIIAHIAASVSWFYKSRLIFYNDDYWTYKDILKRYRKERPRRRPKSESEEQYNERLRAWNNDAPPGLEKKGNSMTQGYYAKKVLPQHIEWLNHFKSQSMPAYLLEDGDPSHGHRSSDNAPQRLREQHHV
ncbi:unnamed protein product [Zymoseptoria tritici ST99CH_3D1]|nr:unnamed protein product [Zymoseptoria tritici ST99CH_3D1]